MYKLQKTVNVSERKFNINPKEQNTEVTVIVHVIKHANFQFCRKLLGK